MENNAETISAMTGALIEPEEIVERAQQVANDGVWGTLEEIAAFEIMTEIDVVVYQEMYDKKKKLTGYKCIRGFRAGTKRSPCIALLHCKMNSKCTSVNHYVYLERKNRDEIRTKVDKLEQEYFYKKKDDSIPKVPMINKNPKPGNPKEKPTVFLKQWESNQWFVYQNEPINGLEVYDFVKKKGKTCTAFYLPKATNREAGKGKIANYAAFLNKNEARLNYKMCLVLTYSRVRQL
jgi:hypothetical protein